MKTTTLRPRLHAPNPRDWREPTSGPLRQIQVVVDASMPRNVIELHNGGHGPDAHVVRALVVPIGEA